jgi:hypothetical protein
MLIGSFLHQMGRFGNSGNSKSKTHPTSVCTRPPTARFFKVVLPVESVYNQGGFAGPAAGEMRALGRKLKLQKYYLEDESIAITGK